MPLDGAPPRELNFDFSNPQLYNPIYIPTFNVRQRFLHYFGSAGSGKSFFAAQKEIVFSFLPHRANRRTLVARRYYNTLGNSCFAELKNVIREWGLEDCFKTTRSPYSIRNLKTGVEFLFVGLDDVEKVKSIRGADRGWLEEATEVRTAQELRQLGLRLRGFEHVQWTLTYNPTSAHHWINRQIHEKMPRDHFIFKTTYRDNVKLLQIQPDYAEYIERMKDEDPNYYRVYGLGLWGLALEGLIYPDYQTKAEMPVEPKAYGLDIGFNDPCALVAVGVEDVPGKNNKQLYWDEVLYKTKLTSTQLVAELDRLKINKNIPIVADHSPAYIEDLRAAGYNVVLANKEKGSIVGGINTVKKYDHWVTANSRNIHREIQNYSWKNKNGRWLDDPETGDAEVQDGVDHAMDGGRYATAYLASLEFDFTLPIAGTNVSKWS